MQTLLKTVANFVLSIFYQLPHQHVEVDTSPFDDMAATLNYFIPFYLIAPIFKVWLAGIGIIIVAISIWGFLKRNF